MKPFFPHELSERGANVVKKKDTILTKMCSLLSSEDKKHLKEHSKELPNVTQYIIILSRSIFCYVISLMKKFFTY